MRALSASDLMNPEVLTVSEDLPVRELAAFLVDNEIGGAPVVDADGRLVGVVSVTDVAAAASEDLAEIVDQLGPDYFQQGWDDSLDPDLQDLELEEDELRVCDIMSEDVHSVSEDDSVSEVASRMLEKHVHRLLVTRGSRLVGIISTSDLLGLLVDEDA